MSNKYTVIVDEFGNTTYYKYGTYEGSKHRVEGPAVIMADGTKEWWINGKPHRDDGPAVERSNGDKIWYREGQTHRDDGPAIERGNGDKLWWKLGFLDRLDGPAVEKADGTKEWWLGGRMKSEAEFLALTNSLNISTKDNFAIINGVKYNLVKA